MKDTITLWRGSAAWMATADGPRTIRLMQLFKTVTLPTAFPVTAAPDVVLARICELNPDVDVVLRSGPSLG